MFPADDQDSVFEGSDEDRHSPPGTYTLPALDYEIDKKFEMVSGKWKMVEMMMMWEVEGGR